MNYLIQKSRHAPSITVHVNDLKKYEGENVPCSWLSPEETQKTSEGEIQNVPHEFECNENIDMGSENVDSDIEVRDQPEGNLPTLPCDTPLRLGGRMRKPPRRFGWED